MTFKALLAAALVAASNADPSVQQHQRAAGAQLKEAAASGRFFLTGTGNPNQSIVIGNGGMVLVGLVTLAFVVAVVIAAFPNRTPNLLGYKSSSLSSSYETTHSVHRALEDTARKHK